MAQQRGRGTPADRSRDDGATADADRVPGQRSLIEETYGYADAPVQRSAVPGKHTLTEGLTPGQVAFGSATSGAGGEVPHRAQMEQAFGTSFAGVQAHLGQGTLSGVGAAGAAQGEVVAFAQSDPSPALVAHELAHVQQQRQAGVEAVAASRPESSVDDAAEREADDVAARVAMGATQVSVSARPSARLSFAATLDPATMKAPPMRPAELATAQRVAAMSQFNGRTFKAPPPPDPGYDWFDDQGKHYDALGDGTKKQYFDFNQFKGSIDHHLLKGNDYTCIDMTGYDAPQIQQVKQYVDTLTPRGHIIRVGF